MKRKYLRDVDTLMEDYILPPTTGLGDVEDSRRSSAIKEVLQTIPEDVYKKLIDSIDDFVWFLPHEHTHGGLLPFFTTTPKRVLKATGRTINSSSNVLYLSPMLENDDIEWAVVVAVVAHELAHIALAHELITNLEEETIKEDEVYKSLCEWGFKEEAIKHREHCKQLEE
jgi:hypothetical protein